MAPTSKKRNPERPARARKPPIIGLENRISTTEECSICFENCKSKCFADNCLHSFCFRCLYKWTKANSNCPLCRTRIRKIYRRVRSTTEYSCYYLQEFHSPQVVAELRIFIAPLSPSQGEQNENNNSN